MENYRLRTYFKLIEKLPTQSQIWVLTAGGILFGTPVTGTQLAQIRSGESSGDFAVQAADIKELFQVSGAKPADDKEIQGKDEEFYLLGASWGKSLEAENISFQWAVVSFDAVIAWGPVG